MKLVIVGGVAGGASAATRARRLSEGSQIVLFERGPDVSFANCGLPYYIGGEIPDRDKLLVVTPDRMRDRYKLDVRIRSSVEAIDRRAKTVRVRDLASGREYDEPYDKLILAPGAAAVLPHVPGIDLPGIFTLRDLRDVDRIKERADRGPGGRWWWGAATSAWRWSRTSCGGGSPRSSSSPRTRCSPPSTRR